MKFKDKLPKLRKENNLLQEQLADRLGVSRQAVSKWESGSSYPDMEKMLQICSILNCTLEDLMDDGTIKGKSNTNSKFNLNTCLNDLLKFITKVYNMFCSMTFKQRIKCLFEMTFIILILFVLTMVIYGAVLNIFSFLPYKAEYVFRTLFSIIYFPIALILATIIFLHLFEIRYLNYFITIEDKNAFEKSIEVPIERIEDKKYVEKKKEKVIIRDPKHSTFNFISGLVKILSLFTQLFALMAYVPLTIAFIILVFLIVVSLYYISYNVIFLFTSLAILGLLSICYAFIESLYKFIISKEQYFKRSFILIISGLVLFGVGSGLTFVKYMSLKKIDLDNYSNYEVETQYIEIKDDTVIRPFPSNDNIVYEIDNSLDKAKVEIYRAPYSNSKVLYYNNKFFDEYYVGVYSVQFRDIYKVALNDLKKNKIRNYDDVFSRVKIYLSQKQYDKLSNNYYKLTGHR